MSLRHAVPSGGAPVGIWLGHSAASSYDDPLARLSAEEREALAKAEGPQGQATSLRPARIQRLRRSHEAIERDDAASSDDNILVYEALLNELERLPAISLHGTRQTRFSSTLVRTVQEPRSIRRETSALHTDP